jgi:phage/plasmid primase-like uncharacterized protein
MDNHAAELSRRLSAQAEAVCRHFLSAGHREGRYWLVGDAHNTPGRSLYVRLTATADGTGPAGKWTDAATGEHGDLLDLIGRVEGHSRLSDTLDAARRFLRLPPAERGQSRVTQRERQPAPRGSAESARRLLAAARPIASTVAQRYLRKRGLNDLRGTEALRFHPRCWYQPSVDDVAGTPTAWPAMVAAVTDLDGTVTGAHRTWLDPATLAKAPVAYSRRAMGSLLGHGVRFGPAAEVMAAGEGIETMLSLRQAMPALPMIAALSAAHLAAIAFPPELRRLYVARDPDPAGDGATATLVERTATAGIELIPLTPQEGDFNGDLCRVGLDAMRAALAGQLPETDRGHFLSLGA